MLQDLWLWRNRPSLHRPQMLGACQPLVLAPQEVPPEDWLISNGHSLSHPHHMCKVSPTRSCFLLTLERGDSCSSWGRL
jgi:hypothetical protein